MVYSNLNHDITSFCCIPLKIYLKMNELTFVKCHESIRLIKSLSRSNLGMLIILNVRYIEKQTEISKPLMKLLLVIKKHR